MPDSPSLVILAGGRGSRFGGMKQVATFGPAGETLFDYAVYDALRSGFGEVVFVVSDESRPAVAEHVAAGCGRHVTVSFVHQPVAAGRSKPAGTGDAVLRTRDAVSGAFGVVNADDFYGSHSFGLLGEHLCSESADHAAVLYRLRRTLSPHGGVSRALCEETDGYMGGITELHDVEETDGGIVCREALSLTGEELVSVNLWGFRESFFDALDAEAADFDTKAATDPSAELLIGDAVQRMIDSGAGRVRAIPTTDPLLGVTYQSDVDSVVAELARLADEGVYPAQLWP